MDRREKGENRNNIFCKEEEVREDNVVTHGRAPCRIKNIKIRDCEEKGGGGKAPGTEKTDGEEKFKARSEISRLKGAHVRRHLRHTHTEARRPRLRKNKLKASSVWKVKGTSP